MRDLHLHDTIERTVHVEVQAEVQKVLMVGCGDEHPLGVDADLWRRGFGRGVGAAIERGAGEHDADLDTAIELEDPVEAVDVVADPAIPGDHQLAPIPGVASRVAGVGARPENTAITLIQGHRGRQVARAGLVLDIGSGVDEENRVE